MYTNQPRSPAGRLFLPAETGRTHPPLRLLQPRQCFRRIPALRFAAGFDSVKVVLSGMSDMDQMLDNLNTFNAKSPLTDTEKALLSDKIVPSLVDQVPCTACRYCCEGCPVELNIPGLIQLHNELPHNCVGCGACTAVCPQGIDIPSAMQQLSAKIADMRK